MSLLRPKMKYEKLTDIGPGELYEKGIRFLILDVDNTVSPYKIDEATEEVKLWADSIDYIKKKKKPSPDGVAAACKKEGFDKSETALVGDQVFTDMLCANRSKVTGILVEPIKFTWPWLRWRYWLEIPFRRPKNSK